MCTLLVYVVVATDLIFSLSTAYLNHSYISSSVRFLECCVSRETIYLVLLIGHTLSSSPTLYNSLQLLCCVVLCVLQICVSGACNCVRVLHTMQCIDYMYSRTIIIIIIKIIIRQFLTSS